MKTRHIFAAFIAFALLSCSGNKKADDPMADSGRTQRTENLLQNLTSLADSAYMFGHHDDTVYGIGWEGDSARSDVKSVCDDYPAMLSFDLGGIELGDSCNLDGVPFRRIREEIWNHYSHGGVTTLSWHLRNPLTGGDSWDVKDKGVVASILEGGSKHELYIEYLSKLVSFLKTLQTPYGVKVPVIFRPYHEHSGSWFWWGQDLCTTQQYKDLWKMTVDYIRSNGIVNVLYAYSPGIESDCDEKKYLERYPGDDIIDIMGLDCYCFGEPNDSSLNNYAEKLDKNLGMVCKVAKAHNKVAALTETGYEAIPYENWWTKTLAPVIDKHNIAYVVVWRNAHNKENHFFAPYPGQISANDFVKFYNDKRSLFLNDVSGLYLEKEKK